MRKTKKQIGGIGDEENCAICLDKMTNTRDNPTIVTPCGHHFHKNCLRDNIMFSTRNSDKCPSCRSNIPLDIDSIKYITIPSQNNDQNNDIWRSCIAEGHPLRDCIEWLTQPPQAGPRMNQRGGKKRKTRKAKN